MSQQSMEIEGHDVITTIIVNYNFLSLYFSFPVRLGLEAGTRVGFQCMGIGLER